MKSCPYGAQSGRVVPCCTLSASDVRLSDFSVDTKSWTCACVNCSDGNTAMAMLTTTQ